VVADRDRQGVPLRPAGAGIGPVYRLHRSQHPSRLRHCRAFRSDRSRSGGDGEGEIRGRFGTGADRVHGRRGQAAEGGRGRNRLMSDIAKSNAPALAGLHPAERPIRKFLIANRAALGSLAVFVAMILIFFVANPRVFSNWGLYAAVLTTLPVALFMTAPQVFVVTSGEIDLSFPATMGFSSLVF